MEIIQEASVLPSKNSVKWLICFPRDSVKSLNRQTHYVDRELETEVM